MRGRLFCSLVIAVNLLVSVSFAQNITSIISGKVRDDFGKPVEGATVLVKEEQRTVATATTDKEGKYRIDNLAVGNYKLTVEKEGLNSESVSDVRLSVASELELDLTMQLNLEGKAIKRVSPAYPSFAKMTRQEGRAVIGVLVKPDGTVEKAIFLGGNPAFKETSMQAAQRWVFQKTNTGLSGRIAFTFKF
jgi:TonB family protein